MDNLPQIVEIGMAIWEPIGCISSVGEDMENLKRKMLELSSQEEDINAELHNAEHGQPRKRRKKEVEIWLGNVQKIRGDVESLDQERHNVFSRPWWHNVFSRPWWQNVFSRPRLGKNIVKKTLEVVELYEKGKFFSCLDRLVIDVPLTCRGFIPPYFVGPISGKNTKVLDLSFTGIQSLPEYISNLENLHALRLESCELLENVPSLGKLKALKEFKLTGSLIQEVPQGIEELVNLEKLDLSFNRDLEMFPHWKLRRLSKLQYLAIDFTRLKVPATVLLCLTQLKVLGAQFHNVEELHRYLKSQYWRGLEKYRLQVGTTSFFRGLDNLHCRVAISIESELSQSGVDQLVLPSSIKTFQLKGCHDLICLSAIPSLRDARDLWTCEVRNCNGMEFIFSSSSFSEDGQIPLTVKTLRLNDLPHCRVFFAGIIPPHTVSFNLTTLYIVKCPRMKNIFPAQLLQNFPNLKVLKVWNCEHLENIIETVETSDLGHRQENNTITLPKLRVLYLKNLPRLESIYEGTMGCESLEEIWVNRCPMLRRLSISLHMDSEQRVTAPPALKRIHGRQGWWESLEWDDPQTKAILQPLFKRRVY